MTTQTKVKNTEEIKKNVENNEQIVQELNEVLSTDKVKEIISKEMAKSEKRWKEAQEFIIKNLAELYKKGEATSKKVEEIFNAIVTEDEVKEELEMIFEAFGDAQSSEVNKALKNLDDELRQVSKPLQVVQNTLEGSGNFFKKILNSFTWKTDAIILSNTMKGIRWRIENISLTLDRAKEELNRNQELLQKLTPKIGLRIAKLQGMSAALEYIINDDEKFDKDSKNLLIGLKQEIDNLAAAQIADLQKLSVLSQINVNNKILLTTTEKKIITKITSALLVNSISGSEKGIKDMAKSVNATLAALDKENSQNVKELLIEEEKEKVRTKVEMENTVKSIEILTKEIEDHNKRMDKIYKDIKKFLPEYKERVQKAEKGIYNAFKNANNDKVNELLNELKAETNELSAKLKT